MFNFNGYGFIIAELENGEQIKCKASLKAKGEYIEWFEPAPVEWMYGWTESEYEIDEDTIEIVYPEEFVLENGEDGEGKLVKFIKDIDIEWEVER